MKPQISTEFLIYHNGWHIASLSAISMRGFVQDGSKGDVYRAAWFERDGSFICFDADEPEVRTLPDV